MMSRTLVTPVMSEGKLRIATKSGLTEISSMIESRFIQTSPIKFLDFCQEWTDRGYTAIFEWCSARTKIVLLYEEDLMVLTGIRHNRTGKYVSFQEMKASGAIG